MSEPEGRITDIRVARWSALKLTGQESPNSVGSSGEREELVAQLRQLADLLQARPEIPVPRYGSFTFNVFADGTDQDKRAQVDYAATLLDAPVSDEMPGGGHYRTRLSFGRVNYEFVAIPKEPEEHTAISFAAGQEVRLAPEVAGGFRRCGIAQAGVIVSTDHDGPGESQYLVRVPGQLTMQLPGRMLEPASFEPVVTSRGPVITLAEAEAGLIEAMARTKMRASRCQQAERHDMADQNELGRALARMCGLPREVLLRQLEGPIAAKTREFLRAERTARRAVPEQPSPRRGR